MSACCPAARQKQLCAEARPRGRARRRRQQPARYRGHLREQTIWVAGGVDGRLVLTYTRRRWCARAAVAGATALDDPRHERIVHGDVRQRRVVVRVGEPYLADAVSGLITILRGVGGVGAIRVGGVGVGVGGRTESDAVAGLRRAHWNSWPSSSSRRVRISASARVSSRSRAAVPLDPRGLDDAIRAPVHK